MNRLLNSSYWEESNDSTCIRIGLILIKLSMILSLISYIIINIFININPILTQVGSLDSSHWVLFNDLFIDFLSLILVEIICNIYAATSKKSCQISGSGLNPAGFWARPCKFRPVGSTRPVGPGPIEMPDPSGFWGRVGPNPSRVSGSDLHA